MQLSFTRSRGERLRHRLGQVLSAPPAEDPIQACHIDEAAYCAVLTKSRIDRVREAFTEVPLMPMEQLALSALLDAPDATSVQLSQACGWSGSAWRMHLILLCQRRRHFLWPGGLGPDATNGLFISALVDYNPDTLTFRFKPDFEDYFQALLAPPPDSAVLHAAE